MKNLKSVLNRIIGRQTESGQAIVLIALFMVVMLAMVGVAIDGGGLFLLWRDAQNAVDTAALQAAYDKCTSSNPSTWQGIGLEAADINGFDATDDGDTIGEDYSADVKEVIVDLKTVDGTEYVHVEINAVKPAYFIQLVYSGPLEVTAEALVYCSGAVDFSDLPGMVGLGGCTCGGNADNRVDFSGARFRVDGDVHSNCNVNANPGNSAANHGDADGTLSGVGTVGDMDKVDETEPAAPNSPPVTLPALLPIDLYFPGGEIYEAINTAHPGYAQYSATGFEFDNFDDDPLEGLYATDGDFTIDVNFNPTGDDFGPNGITVVARGKINYNGLVRDGNWFYYGHNVNNPGGHEGVTVRWSRGNGSALAMYSLYDSRTVCSGGTTATGIQLVSNGSGDDDTDVDGIVLAPYTSIAWQGPSITAHGPIIGWALDFSGADFHWIPEPAYLQPMAPVINNAK